MKSLWSMKCAESKLFEKLPLVIFAYKYLNRCFSEIVLLKMTENVVLFINLERKKCKVGLKCCFDMSSMYMEG